MVLDYQNSKNFLGIMMITRTMQPKLEELARKFPVVTITGPRQSGKSTLAKMTFPDYSYVSLENPNMREFAEGDPEGFLATYDGKVIIDETQRVPSLFNYLQERVDAADAVGQYILSGSQNFLLMESVTQSLAGRTALLKLYPLSQSELVSAGMASATLNEWLLKGGFPRIFRYDIDPLDYYPAYIQTYLERDVREQSQVGSLDAFRRFMQLCAGRIGCILDKESLSNEAGVNIKTTERWLSILQASSVVILVRPFVRNFNKRLVKRSKLYLCDTGLAASLLGLRTLEDVMLSPFRGALFENLVLLERLKREWASGTRPNVWFWQETATNEVDFIFGTETKPEAVEAKSGATFDSKWFKSMKIFTELAGLSPQDKAVVYGGDERIMTSAGAIIPWREW